MITETTITDEDQADADPSGFHLLIMSPEYFASHSLPPSGSVTIGRSSKCAVRIDDPMASREHARIHVTSVDGAAVITIEDLGSANGTRVRDGAVRGGDAMVIAPGEGVIIGSTVVMVMQNGAPSGLSRLWSHPYFGSRLDDECARATRTKAPFALARVRFHGQAARMKVLPILARTISSAHGVAVYGPKDYEILFTDITVKEAEAIVERLVSAFKADGLDARGAIASFPKDGKTGDALLESANGYLKGRVGTRSAVNDSVGMKHVRDMATRVAPSAINIMIRGETGVGKDVLARFVHGLSPRADKPFLALNCAGMSETLLESELFGHAKGTFTGAVSAKVGLLETADGGTVFLDEIGDMPITVQARLLRVIEDRQIRPLGSVHSRTVNVRFLSATHKDIEDAVSKGEFRQDLLFRLNGMSLVIPPLRERKDEIPVLAQTFIDESCNESGRNPSPVLGSAAVTELIEHDWKGNIRELKNVIERAMVLCDGPEVMPEHLELRPSTAFYTPTAISRALPRLTDPEKFAERQRIIDALEACASNQTRAAQLLRMPRRTFISKLDHYQIPRPQKDSFPAELTKAEVAPAPADLDEAE